MTQTAVPRESVIQFRIRRYADGRGPRLTSLGDAPVVDLTPYLTAPLGRTSKASTAVVNNDPLLTKEQFAEYLNVSERKARTWMEERRVPVIPIGRSLRVRRSDADALIAALLQPAARPVRVDAYRREVWVGRAR